MMKNAPLFRVLPLVALISALSACDAGKTGSQGQAGAAGQTGSTGQTGATGAQGAPASNYVPGNLLVSRTAYDSTYTVSGQLPYNATPETTNASPVTAVTPGTFPNVFTNDANDGNFGVTTEAYLDQWVPGANSASQTTDITAQAASQLWNFSTSFASKSELSLSLSLDKTAVTFMGYNAPIDTIDASNSSTPGVVDPTNTDVQTPTYRTVAQLNFADNSLHFTNTNAYSGNNGRAAVLANNMYYLVGNAGNSGKNPKPTTSLLDTLTMDTGVQSIVPDSSCAYTQVIGAFQSGTGTGTYAEAPAGTACSLASLGSITGGSSTGDEFGFSIASLPSTAADKTGKDDNFRGMFVGPDGTLYVSKGSGGNGVNTVFQVGATGALANGGSLPQSAPITIVPGFTTSLATNIPSPITAQTTLSTGTMFPFGMWIPSTASKLMFVADEGDGTSGDQTLGSGGLWVYQNQSGTWHPIAWLTQGLNLGVPYTVADTTGVYGVQGASYTTTPDGLRNITGQINSDGSYTIYATTSTIGNSLGSAFDAGADSNQLVKITLSVSGSTVTSAGFSVMQTAPFGQALRGVAIIPKY